MVGSDTSRISIRDPNAAKVRDNLTVTEPSSFCICSKDEVSLDNGDTTISDGLSKVGSS